VLGSWQRGLPYPVGTETLQPGPTWERDKGKGQVPAGSLSRSQQALLQGGIWVHLIDVSIHRNCLGI